MRNEALEEEFVLALGGVGVPAGELPDERWKGMALPTLGDVLGEGLASDRRHGPPVLARIQLQIALELLGNEDRGTFHMLYAIIQRTLAIADANVAEGYDAWLVRRRLWPRPVSGVTYVSDF